MLSGAILQSLGAFAIIIACIWLGFNGTSNPPIIMLLAGLALVGIGWTYR